MIDAFTRAICKPQNVLPGLSNTQARQTPLPPPPPGTRLRREPDGPVSLKVDGDTNFHIPSPFRIGYRIDFHLS